MYRTAGAARELLCVLAALVAGCALLASPALASGGEVGVLAGVVGLALCALCCSHRDVALLRSLGTPSPAVRARRRAPGHVLVPRQIDPDAPGRPRPRAPGRLAAAQA